MIDNRQGILITVLQRFRLRTNIKRSYIYKLVFLSLKAKHAVTFKILFFEFTVNNSIKSKLHVSVLYS